MLDRQAFFGSILATLNHIVVADIIWLKRFTDHPAKHSELEIIRSLSKPQSLDQMLFDDFSELSKHRKVLDGVIVNWANVLTDDELNQVLHYANTKGIPGDKKSFNLLMHFFNHQTHHRGQVTTLLSQVGVDYISAPLLHPIMSLFWRSFFQQLHQNSVRWNATHQVKSCYTQAIQVACWVSFATPDLL